MSYNPRITDEDIDAILRSSNPQDTAQQRNVKLIIKDVFIAGSGPLAYAKMIHVSPSS